jgi:hypothetical protein
LGRAIVLVVFLVRSRCMRFVVVLSSALEGCCVAVCVDVDIAVGIGNSIGHLIVGAIFFDYRRGTS